MKTGRFQTLAVCIGILALSSSIARVHGHGALTVPLSRNTLHFLTGTYRNYCSHCMNGGGVGATSSHGDGWTPQGSVHGLCGDAYSGDQHHVLGGQWATGFTDLDVIGQDYTYTAGQDFMVRVNITAHHQGVVTFRLCVLPDNDPTAEVTEACLEEHPLERSDGSGERFYLPLKVDEDLRTGGPTGQHYPYEAYYKMPEGISCERCVLQMYWITGNTCYADQPEAYDDAFKFRGNLRTCTESYPEEFWNCADIKVLPSEDSPPSPPPPPPASPSPPSPPPPPPSSPPPPTNPSPPPATPSPPSPPPPPPASPPPPPSPSPPPNPPSAPQSPTGAPVPSAQPSGCFVASGWHPHRMCSHNPLLCDASGGVWDTLDACCAPGTGGHSSGCSSYAEHGCYVAAGWNGHRTCQFSLAACGHVNQPGKKVWSTKYDCCAPGAGHPDGCSD